MARVEAASCHAIDLVPEERVVYLDAFTDRFPTTLWMASFVAQRCEFR
jgi:hypothetical protein